MSTRAVYTFIDSNDEFHVYKKHDGYPSGAATAIKAAIPFAWELPRFEADDFGSAFVAANKPKKGGDIRLTSSYLKHGDLEFRYEISFENGKLHIQAFKVDWRIDDVTYTRIFSGSLDEFIKFSAKE